jgi:putative transposase
MSTPKRESILNDKFLQQFKTGEELESFVNDIYSRGLEQILQGEMDSHLGYSKHDLSGQGSGNSRNGTTSKEFIVNMVHLQLLYLETANPLLNHKFCLSDNPEPQVSRI